MPTAAALAAASAEPADPAPADGPAAPSVRALYRQLWTHAAGARARLGAALALLGSSTLLKMALPWMAAQAIDAMQARGREGLATSGAWIAGILGLYGLVWALHGPARVMERDVALRVRRSVFAALYERLCAAPLAWHEQHHSADLQHRVATASRALQSFAQTQFIYLQGLINMVGPVIALALLAPLIGGVAAGGVALIAAVVVHFDRTLLRLATEETAAERRHAARLLDCLGNVASLFSLRLESATGRMLEARLAEVFAPLRRAIVLNEWKWCLVDISSVALTWSLVVLYALQQLGQAPAAAAGVAGPGLMLGGLFMVYQYGQQASSVLASMAGNYQALTRMQSDFGTAAPVWAAPARPGRRGPAAGVADSAARATPAAAAAASTDAAPAVEGWQRLRFDDLHFRREAGAGLAPGEEGTAGRGGLHGVSIELRRGERLALVGPSGAGKSTLLRVMAGLYEPWSGRLSIDGAPAVPPRAAAAFTTLIGQEAEIFEATLGENVTLGAPADPARLQRALQASALDEVMQRMPHGLATPISERGANLSGGQRQRLALARGMLAADGAALLLLDEPTSALDALTELRVHHRLDAAFPDACIVASVHRLGLLAHFDRVAWLEAGRLVDVGTVDELRARLPAFDAMLRGVDDAPAMQPAAASAVEAPPCDSSPMSASTTRPLR